MKMKFNSNQISHIKTKLESVLNPEHNVFDIIFQLHPTPQSQELQKIYQFIKYQLLKTITEGGIQGQLVGLAIN